MTSPSRRARRWAVGAVVVAVGLLGIAPMGAAGESARVEWVVTNPDPEGEVVVASGTATMHNLDTGTEISCTDIDGGGIADSGITDDNHFLAVLYPLIYQGCRAADGTAFEAGALPWAPVGTAYDAATDRLSGWVWDDDDLVYMWTPAFDCMFGLVAPVFGEPAEQLQFVYDNTSSTLEVSHPGLVVDEVDGPACTGIAHNGDRVAFSATFHLTPQVTIRPA